MFNLHSYRENYIFPDFLPEKITEEKKIPIESEKIKEQKQINEEGCMDNGEKESNPEEFFLDKLMKKFDRKLKKNKKIEKKEEEEKLKKKTKRQATEKLSSPIKKKQKNKKPTNFSIQPPPRQLSKKALERFNSEFLPSNLNKSQSRIKKINKNESRK